MPARGGDAGRGRADAPLTPPNAADCFAFSFGRPIRKGKPLAKADAARYDLWLKMPELG